MSQPSEMTVDVIVPARNEEDTVAEVVRRVPTRLCRSVVVVDNGSKDRTADAAEAAGALVVRESRPGYGAACLRALAHLATLPRPPDAVVFLPADGSCAPEEIGDLLQPLRENLFDLVLGSRALGEGGLKPTARAANFVALGLIKAIYGHRYTDLAPYFAVRYPALVALGLRDTGYGFLAEVQVKALKIGLRLSEVPVTYRPRAGRPHISHQVKRAAGTTTKVLFQILRHSTTR